MHLWLKMKVALMLLLLCMAVGKKQPDDPLAARLAQVDVMLDSVLDVYRGYQSRLLDLDASGVHEDPYAEMFMHYRKPSKPEKNASATPAMRSSFTDSSSHRPLVAHLHTNVIFVGFPTATIEMLQSTWFAALGREDALLATLGSTGETVRVPHVTVQHQFHLVQISFHVADVLTDLLAALLDRGRVNAWEVEEALEDLAGVVAKAGASKGGAAAPAATVFLLNLKLPFPYEYAVGFEASSLRALAQSKEVVDLARQALRAVKRPVRVEEGVGTAQLAGRQVSSLSPEGSLASAQTALERWLGQQDAGAEDSSSSSGSSSGRVYLRDIVKETRTWAKNYAAQAAAAGDASKSPEARARRFLADPGPDQGPRAAQRLALARSILSASQGADEPAAPQCGSQSWLGSGKVVWTDLRARHNPPLDVFSGASLHAPAPRLMDDHEWLQLGAANSRRDLGKEVVRGRAALLRHQRAVQGFYSQAHCPAEVLEDALGEYTLREAMSFRSFVSRVAYDAYPSAGFLRPSCAVFVMQVGLLSFALRHSEGLDEDIAAYEQGAQARGELDAMLVRETREAHLRTLTAVLQASNVLVDTPHAHAGLVSHDAAIYLGYMGALLQQASRFVLSPPLALHLDAYHPDLPMPRTAPRTESTIPSKASSSSERESGDGRPGPPSRLAAITADVSALSHAHSGDSLLDYVRSADHAAMDVGPAQAEKEALDGPDPVAVDSLEAAAQADDELKLWGLLMPPMLFPVKIEVKVYVVQIQQSYDPLMKSIGGAGEVPTGFDYTALIQQLSRLRLPSQALVVSLETVRPAADPGVALALASCMRRAVTTMGPPADAPGAAPGLGPAPSRDVNYLDSNCVWAHVQHYDEADVSRGPSGGPGAAGNGWRARGANKFLSTTQTVPLLVLSLDTPSPTYIDSDYQLAASVGHAVLVVQNSQGSVPVGYTCGGAAVTVSGRNPMPAAAQQLAKLIAGLPPKSVGHCGAPSAGSLLALALPRPALPRTVDIGAGIGGNVRVDPGVFFGQSPSFAAASFDAGPAVFSSIEVDASHRSRVLRALGVARVLAARQARQSGPERFFSEWDAAADALGEEAATDGAARGVGGRELRWGPLTGIYSEALEALARGDWSAAAALSNAVHFLLRELRDSREVPEAFHKYFEQLPGGGSQEQDGAAGGDEGGKSAVWGDVLCLVCAAVVSFFLTRAARSKPRDARDGRDGRRNPRMLTPEPMSAQRYTEL